MSKAKAKGTAAETAVVKYLIAHGFSGAERRALGGGGFGEDLGDITGTPCLTWEVKNQKKYSLLAWLREAEKEKDNAGADFCPLIVKPVGVGIDNVKNWFFVMTVDEGVALLQAAGFGDGI